MFYCPQQNNEVFSHIFYCVIFTPVNEKQSDAEGEEMSNKEQNIKSGEDGANTGISQTEGRGHINSHANQNSLPPKKRFENQNFNSWKEGPQPNEESKTEERQKVSILAGVIRHTSCPDNTLAYYYNYNSGSK